MTVVFRVEEVVAVLLAVADLEEEGEFVFLVHRRRRCPEAPIHPNAASIAETLGLI